MVVASPVSAAGARDGEAVVRDLVARRIAASERYFQSSARAIVDCAARLADLFYEGATLWVFGGGPQASDAQHNAVEFLHPVLPGCRALPAVSLAAEASTLSGLLQGGDPDEVYAHQLRVLGRSSDVALALAVAPVPKAVERGLVAARRQGMMTVALIAGEGETVSADVVLAAADPDPLVAQELHLATYHILWELTHIVLNHRGLPPPERTSR